MTATATTVRRPSWAVTRGLAVLWMTSVIAFFYGLIHLTGEAQIGGPSGRLFHGWEVALGGMLMFVGCWRTYGAVTTAQPSPARSAQRVMPLVALAAGVAIFLFAGRMP